MRKGLLSKIRAIEIINALTEKNETFVCHKTIDYKEIQHCAGALVLLEKINKPNQLMRVMERVGEYNRFELDMDSNVFDTPDDFIKSSR